MQVFIKQSQIKNDHIALEKSNGWNFKYAAGLLELAHAFPLAGLLTQKWGGSALKQRPF